MNNSASVYNFLKTAIIVLTALTLLIVTSLIFSDESQPAISQVGSSGAEVRAIQEKLKERGLFTVGVTGYYGEQTRQAVLKFQKQQGIQQTGVAGPATLKALGISIGSAPAATSANVNLLARIISAEARGEPYTGR